MGCLGFGIAFLLALAVPASIAPTSLVGAYVVIVVLAVLAFAGWSAWTRRRPAGEGAAADKQPVASRARIAARIAAVAIVYAAVATAIHALT